MLEIVSPHKTTNRQSKTNPTTPVEIMKIAELLIVGITIINHTTAFVSDRKLNLIVSAANKPSRREVKLASPSKPRSVLHSSLASSDTTHTCKSIQDGIVRNTVFPVPEPISEEELHSKGLPILVAAAKHAKAGRIICTELPENGCVTVSYRTVLRDSTKLSKYITSVMKKDDNESVGDFTKPRTIAHLTEPGSEYLSSMWGVSILLARY